MAPAPRIIPATILMALTTPALGQFSCVFAPAGGVVGGAVTGLMTQRHYTGNFPGNENNVMPLAVVVYRGASMPDNRTAVEVQVRFWMSLFEPAGDCLMPCTWNGFPADTANASLVIVNLPYQSYDDFRDAYITPYATAAPGTGVCFTTGEIIACSMASAMNRSAVSWTTAAHRPGYVDPCLTCQNIETFPGEC